MQVVLWIMGLSLQVDFVIGTVASAMAAISQGAQSFLSNCVLFHSYFFKYIVCRFTSYYTIK